ncbi:MAG: c-type cytochrome biogenesis protein CcsB [Clostridia bacterium]|nr:c-type cytochrome biogenesis protein CcsB [Clostridia bacterium]
MTTLSSEQVAFAVTAVLYLVAAVAYFRDFYAQPGSRFATAMARAAWVAHTATLLVGVVTSRQLPIFSTYDAVLLAGWFCVLGYLVLEAALRLYAVGAFLFPVAFTFLVYASALPRSAVANDPFVRSSWVVLHVLIAIGGYGALILAFIAALLYLVQERQLRGKVFRRLYHRLPSLATLDALALRLVVIGFPLLTLALVTGAVWARVAWGTYWSWEPKEFWTLVTWLVYAAYLLVRAWAGIGGRRAAYFVVAGFAAVVFNFVFVNLVLTRRHFFF